MDANPFVSSQRAGSLERVRASWRSRLMVYGLIYVLWLVVLCAGTGGFANFHIWLTSWSKWDAQWYERIWNEGYRRGDPRALVFPPGYSVLVGALATFLHLDFHLMAMVVNVISYFAAMVLAVDLFAKFLRVSPAPAFALALSSPAAYFVFAAYSDAVFCFILWAALYLALICPLGRVARVTEFCLLLVAPWIRLTGYAFSSWMLLKRWTALAVCASLLGWLVLNFVIAGHPLYFLQAQKLFIMPEGNFVDGFRSTFSGLLPVYFPGLPGDWAAYFQFHLLPAIYLLGLAFAGIWLCYQRCWLIGITVLSILFVSHNQSFWRSAVRYDLAIFCCLSLPLLVVVHDNRPKLVLRVSLWAVAIVVGVAQIVLQIYFANLFKSGRWAF